ncbi:MAG: type II secretion system F family protein [Pseudomonadales bacterium]
MASEAVKNSTFVWQGTDKRGQKTNGEISGFNSALVKAQLRKQGISPTKVKKKQTSIFSAANKKKITPADITLFTRQMATMMKAGVPLVQSFDIVADGLDNANMKELIGKIKTDVAAGSGFAIALRKHPRHFDDLMCNLVDAGEQSGALETMLERLATYKEKSESLKKKIKKAMTYPIAVIVIAVVVTGILLVKVVPTFEEIFQGFGAELPAFTQFVINISNVLQAWWYIVVIGVVAFIFIVKEALIRSKNFSNSVDRGILKVPVIGEILLKSVFARFSRTLSTTFAAGVPLVEALTSTAGATGNYVYATAVERIREDVSTGQQLNFSMRNTGVFPNMLVQMTAIGEESGALDDMLDKAAEHYEEEVDNAVDNLTALLEPLIMSVLGVLIGGLIIAMYLPIFKMGQIV